MSREALDTLRPARSVKAFRRGTHRLVPPEETLRRVEPLLAAMGITRVGMLTGLDRLGLPVAMAVRPNGRALAVAQGRGVTAAAAKVSSIMEAAEAFHAETVTGPLHRASAAELDGAVDPRRLPRSAGSSADDPAGARCLWIAGRDLSDGTERWVPFELVHADYTVPGAEPARFQATTSGLAAGNVAVEAQLHALYEAIERDAIACWREAGGPGSATGRAIDLSAVDDPDLAELLDRIAAADIDVAAWEVTSDIAVTVIVALLVPRGSGIDAVEAELGSGCHLDPAVALSRALTESSWRSWCRAVPASTRWRPSLARAATSTRRWRCPAR